LKLVKDTSRQASLLRAKGDFITVAAHQLRTPTTAINWAFENLKKDLSLPDTAKEMIVAGYQASQNLLKIVNDLLNVAQVEEGRFGYQLQESNLVEFLDKLLLEALPVAKQYGIALYFERPPEAKLMVSIDRAKLALVVSNLVDNAIKYNVPDGQIVVTLAKKDNMAEVAVKDTGVGIAKEDLPQLFTKFFRSKTTAKLSIVGSGLGLYLAKNIITEHKGKIWVESVIDRGSTFYFTLPLN
jgi:signal transduction histidine kinase